MFVECLAIVAIILAMAFLFLRKGKKDYAIGSIPILFVPAIYMIGDVLIKKTPIFKQTSEQVNSYIFLILLALIAACIAFGILSSKFKKKSSRNAYIFTCGGFSLLLSLMLIFDLIKSIQ